MLGEFEEKMLTRVDHASATVEMRRLFDAEASLSLTEVWLETKHGQRIRIGMWRDSIQAFDAFEKLLGRLERRGSAEVMEYVRLEAAKKSAFNKEQAAQNKAA